MKPNTKTMAMCTTIIVCAIVGMFVFVNAFPPEGLISTPKWHEIEAERDPGAGATGMLEIFVYPHAAAPAATYANNLTEGNSYSYGSTTACVLTGDVPYDTTFDLVIKVRANKTHAYNTSSNTWMLTWVRANMTCAALGIGALTAMAEQNISGTTNGKYIWVNYYMNNGGAGYTISHGQNVNVTAWKFEAYY